MISEGTLFPLHTTETPEPATLAEANQIETLSKASLSLANVYGSTDLEGEEMNREGKAALETTFTLVSPDTDSDEFKNNLENMSPTEVYEQMKRAYKERDKKLIELLQAPFAQINSRIGHLEHIAHFDRKTGAMEHSFFLQKTDQVARENPSQSVAILRIDLNEFKKVNDLFGHHVGDAYLVKVAEVIQGIIPTSAFLGRVGGDEFSICLPNHDLAMAEAIKQRINEGFIGQSVPAPTAEKPERTIFLRRASIGAASAIPTGAEKNFAQTLDKKADDEQIADKILHKNTVEVDKREELEDTISPENPEAENQPDSTLQ